MLSIVILLITLALIFDFINGFHDAANSIATVVSTRVLSPAIAVGWAALFNFIAARSEEHTSELQSRRELVCRRLREKKNRRASTRRRPGSLSSTCFQTSQYAGR